MTQQAASAPATGDGVSLVVRNLEMRYGAVNAVADVSFDVPAGSFLTLLGASGSGKTTVLRMIAGFEPSGHGRIEIGGLDVSTLPAHRRDIGMVFQRYALFPHMSVAENIAFPLRQRGVSRDERQFRVTEMLEHVSMSELGDRRPSQLSGGQQQRVALARALVFKPRVLLLDEPLAALDKQLRDQMQNEIRALQRRLHITTVYVTHDQSEAFALSDRVAVMNAGRIEQLATPRELYEMPNTERVARFVGDSNLLRGRPVHGNSLRLTDGSLIRCPRPLPGKTQATVMIRPEKLDLHTSDARTTGYNAMHGVVLDVVFLGEIFEYRVQAGDEEFLVRKQNLGCEPLLAGTPVTLTWAVRDTVVLS
ncbi:MAG TPA: ABC transporter ATP-binding protein [Steroidobacter sp.]|nr:ABC transporter ATP-binding protein [Steroidobacter sp.]